MKIGQNSRAIIVLPSILTSQDINLGIRVDLLKDITISLEKKGYIISIGTLRKSQPLFNYSKDEKLKNWISYYLSEKIKNKFGSKLNNNEPVDYDTTSEIDRLMDIKDIIVEEFDLIIIPSYLNFYEEMYDQYSNIIELLWNFFIKNKILILIGHSVFSLTKIMTKSNKSKNINDYSLWPFSSYYLTGTSVSSIFNCDYFSSEEFLKFMDKNSLKNNFLLNLSVEQETVDKGGIYVNHILAEHLMNSNLKLLNSSENICICYHKSGFKREINDNDFMICENDFDFDSENDGNVISVKCNNLITGNCNNSLKYCINMINS